MKLSFSVTLLLIISSAWAQTGPFDEYQPLQRVGQFLQLSDSQLQTILTNNAEYNQWAWDKQSRIRQVQSEIADETGKSPLDPNALGIRYAEIETICRQMRDQANEYQKRNVDLLSQDQKARLKVLDDAMKLAAVISEAQSGNLIGGSYAPVGFVSTSATYTTSGAMLPNGCYLPSARWFDTTTFVGRSRTIENRTASNLIKVKIEHRGGPASVGNPPLERR